MPYESFSLEELVLDDAFREWVLHPEPTAEAFWQRFLQQHPEKQPLIDEARRLVGLLRVQETPLTEAEIRWALIRMRRALDQPEVTPTERRPGRLRRVMTSPAFRAAAMFTLVAGASGWWYFKTRTLRYETDFGESRRVELPDGSVVTLNANSELAAPPWKAGQIREVWLTGEAFFEVTHQPNDARFIVHTSDLAVEVVGTTFNVTRRRDHTQVVLNTGKVLLHLEEQPQAADIAMRPGDFVEVSAATRQVVRRVVRPTDYSAWQQRKLVFNNTSVGEIAQLIEDTYGLPVRFEDPTLARRRLSGTVPSNNRRVLVRALSALLDDTIEEEDGVLIFKK